MFSCDYNGWADVPEEEREAIDAFENSEMVGATARWWARQRASRRVVRLTPAS